MTTAPVVVAGGGVAGLACALELQARGVPTTVLEASDEVGGRVRTDLVDGFLLDRGFQVCLTAYPEVRRTLDLDALDLRPFAPGALVRHAGRFHAVADPWRMPFRALLSLFGPVGTLRDKRGVARLRAEVRAAQPEALLERPDATTRHALASRGFSDSIVDRFFRPFLSGVFLERDLATSSRLFEYLFRTFACGAAALPARGIGEIPRQLAGRLRPGTVRLGARVDAVADGRVTLASGEPVAARAVVVATDGTEAASLAGVEAPGWNSVTCFQFAARRPPIRGPWLVLNGEPDACVNDLVVASEVSPRAAPPGQALVVASVPGTDGAQETRVREELAGWWGDEVRAWRLLRAVRIAHALPAWRAPAPTPAERPPQVRPGLFVAGDHRSTPSLQGALSSGRRAAEAVVAALSS